MKSDKRLSSPYSNLIRAGEWLWARIAATKLRREVVIGSAICGVVFAMLPDGSRASLIHAGGSSGVDPAAILDARSPGSRPVGALYQTKQRLAASTRSSPIIPEQRVLSSVRDRPATPYPGYVALNRPELASVLSPEGFGGSPSVPGLAPGLPALLIDPLPFSLPPNGIGPPRVPPTTPPAAVPEPSTWLLLISGYTFLGWRLRRRLYGQRKVIIDT